MKILVGIVTFNRRNLLERCITSINDQTYKNFELVVINNSSTDSTEHYLEKNKIKHITQENKGASFGWKKLIELAKSNNYDYLWLMDDDGYPDRSSLEILTSQIKKKKYNILNSLVLNIENHSELAFGLPVLDANFFPKIFSIPRKIIKINKLNNMALYPFCHLFNGSLISVEALKKVGNINTKFKMYGDELDLYYRIKKLGDCFTVIKSLHYHPKPNFSRINTVKAKYLFYNTLIINKTYLPYSLIRNTLFFMKFIILTFGKINIFNVLFSKKT